MLTRSRAKMALQNVNSEEMSQEFEVNNQLGVSETEEMTISTDDMRREEEHSNRARGQSPDPQLSMMEMLAEMMKRQDKIAEEQNERFNKQDKNFEEQNKIFEELKRSTEEIREENKKIKESIKRVADNLEEKLQTVKHDLQQQITRLVSDNQEQNVKLNKEIEEIKKCNEYSKKEINRRLDRQTKEMTELREKDRHEWQEAVKVVEDGYQRRSDGIEQQVRSLRERQNDNTDKINSVSVEKGKRLDEMATNLSSLKEDQQRVQRRLEEIEQRPAVAANGVNVNKELTFDGEDNFPMEFLKELREIQEMYYPAENTKWLGKHLTGEAAIWWRIVREQVRNFQEFADVFTEKYWGAIQQERIRDQLEYGRYNANGSRNMVQYMEQRVLQCRQLIPVLPDRHLIKKLARHYDREIQIAVVIRGITTINGFEALLLEYMGINTRNQDAQKKPYVERPFNKFKNESGSPNSRELPKGKPVWDGGRYSPTQAKKDERRAVNSIVIERQQPAHNESPSQPSTSRDTKV